MFPPVLSDSLSWDAVATVLTGFAAVGAAAWVGAKQLGIAHRQADIQEAQAEAATAASKRDNDVRLQELRFALFDRRFQLIEEFRIVWTEWSQQGCLNPQTWEVLRLILQKARLLFSESLCADLEISLNNIDDHNRFRQRAAQYENDKIRSQQYLEKIFSAEDAIDLVMPELLNRMVSETRISEPGSP